MNIEQLKNRANEIMQKHKVDEVFATKDGNIFLPKDKSSADFHAKNTGQKLLNFKSETEEDADLKPNKKEALKRASKKALQDESELTGEILPENKD